MIEVTGEGPAAPFVLATIAAVVIAGMAAVAVTTCFYMQGRAYEACVARHAPAECKDVKP